LPPKPTAPHVPPCSLRCARRVPTLARAYARAGGTSPPARVPDLTRGAVRSSPATPFESDAKWESRSKRMRARSEPAKPP
jgi:hypothetical protein